MLSNPKEILEKTAAFNPDVHSSPDIQLRVIPQHLGFNDQPIPRELIS
jgi:hypothetical protein